MGDVQSENLQWAVQNGDVDQVRKILHEENNLANEHLRNGRPPLCVAADYGHTDVIKVLIENGAKVNVSDKHGITPLLSAIYEGHQEAVSFLISEGAEKTGKAPDGSSYVECAPTSGIKSLLA